MPGGLQNFEEPKSIYQFDPYGNGEDSPMETYLSQNYQSIKYDDRLKLRASIIIDTYA